jgi:hypothetical protein
MSEPRPTLKIEKDARITAAQSRSNKPGHSFGSTVSMVSAPFAILPPPALSKHYDDEIADVRMLCCDLYAFVSDY